MTLLPRSKLLKSNGNHHIWARAHCGRLRPWFGVIHMLFWLSQKSNLTVLSLLLVHSLRIWEDIANAHFQGGTHNIVQFCMGTVTKIYYNTTGVGVGGAGRGAVFPIFFYNISRPQICTTLYIDGSKRIEKPMAICMVKCTYSHPSPPKKLNFADFIEDQFCPIKCEEVFVRRHRGVHHKALVNLFIGNSTFGDTGTSIMIFCTGLRKCLFWTFILEAPA